MKTAYIKIKLPSEQVNTCIKNNVKDPLNIDNSAINCLQEEPTMVSPPNTQVENNTFEEMKTSNSNVTSSQLKSRLNQSIEICRKVYEENELKEKENYMGSAVSNTSKELSKMSIEAVKIHSIHEKIRSR